MWRNNRIVVTRSDLERLRAILGRATGLRATASTSSICAMSSSRRAWCSEDEVPSDVVTLQSQVRVRDHETGIASDYTVVSPAQADVSSGHVSVLAPLGTALLGYREGDEVEWQMPGGFRRLRIERVRQPQPLAADRSARNVHAARRG